MRASWLLIAALASGAVSQVGLRGVANAKRDTWPRTESHKSVVIKYAAPALGRELTADILWAKTLVYYGGNRIAESDFRYLEPLLDAVLEVDPYYHRVYRWAAFAVTHRQGTATQEEFLTSLKYVHEGLKYFPDDHELWWLGGTRYFFDLKATEDEDPQALHEKGAEMIETAMRKADTPAKAKWYAELAASLRTKMGQHKRAIHNLHETILTVEDPKAREKLLEKLRTAYIKPDMADELERVLKKHEAEWAASMPYASPTFYLMMGPKPSATIDWDELANDHDLFGAPEIQRELDRELRKREEDTWDFEPPADESGAESDQANP